MKLFFTPGVCSQAPHILLHEAGLPFELVLVDKAKKTYDGGKDYLAINRNGYVPALEIEPGVVLTEGPAIMQYIADQTPDSGLAPANGTLARYRLQSWLNFITSEIHKGFSPLFNPKWPAEAKQLGKEQLAKRLETVEIELGKHEFLTGNVFTAADAYLFVVTGWAGFVGLDLTPFPNLLAFRQRVAKRPAVQAALAAEGLAKHAA